MTVESPAQLATLWKATGGTNCAIAVAVALAESSGRTDATNFNHDSHHSEDRGLWQINSYWHPEVSSSCAFDASCNARSAKTIAHGGSNWTPWATYNGGNYKKHLATATAACGGSLLQNLIIIL